MNTKLKLGIIGMSEGNGHPYSWPAIFNGYDPGAMASCPFPAIPEYLARQKFPEAQLSQAEVTHIWTQDNAVSEHIAKASRIPHIAVNFQDLIGQVDAVLLARDDAANHLHFARPFLEAGLPVYIDKPLALSVHKAQELLALQQYPGQLFSCSPLKFSPEATLTEADRKHLGRIRLIEARIPKYWPTYAVHLIEPSLDMLGEPAEITHTQNLRSGNLTLLQATFGNDTVLAVTCTGNLPSPAEFVVTGEKGRKVLAVSDSFTAFRNTLQKFIEGVQQKKQIIPTQKTLQVVKLIEAGLH